MLHPFARMEFMDRVKRHKLNLVLQRLYLTGAPKATGSGVKASPQVLV